MNDKKFDAMFNENGSVIINKEALEVILKEFRLEYIIEAFELSEFVEDLVPTNLRSLIDLIFDIYDLDQIRYFSNRILSTILCRSEFEEIIDVFGLSEIVEDLAIPNVGLMIELYNAKDNHAIMRTFGTDINHLELLIYCDIIDLIIDHLVLEFIDAVEFHKCLDMLYYK